MNVGEIVQRVLRGWQPQPSPRLPERPLPTPEEVRWAQAERDALVRRARFLNVDIELERAGR